MKSDGKEAILRRGWERIPTGVVLPLCFLALGIFLFLQTLAMEGPDGMGEGLKPGFWPQLLLFIFFGACLVSIIQAFRQNQTSQPVEPAAGEAGKEAIRSQRKIWLAMGLLFLFVLGHEALGFMFATALFLVAFSLLWGGKRPLSIISVSLVGTAGLMILFVKVVYLPFPKGYGVLEDVTIFVYRALGIF